MSENNQEVQMTPKAEKSTPPKNNKKFLVIYSIALFLFAGVLIVLSYLSQAKVAANTNQIREDLKLLTEKTDDVSVGVQTRLEQVSAKNDDLEKANASLTEENEALKKQVETLQPSAKQAQAAEYMWQIVKAHEDGKEKDCKKLIESLNSNGLREFLSQPAANELSKIEKSHK